MPGPNYTSTIGTILCTVALLGLMACTVDEPTPTPEDSSLERRVLVIGIDGLRADAWTVADTPNIDRIADNGTVSNTASTQTAADLKSGPGWASLLTGVEPTKHNIYANGAYDDQNRSYKSFLERSSDAGLRSVYSTTWLDIATIIGNGNADKAYPAGDSGHSGNLVPHIDNDDFDIYFVHFDAVDHAGHLTGFDPENPVYLAAIEEIDGYMGPLLDAVDAHSEQQWMVMLSTDHGGLGNDHGPHNPETLTIPLMVRSPQHSATTVQGGTHMDIAPTVLDYLGVPVPEDLDGSAFPQ